VQFAYGPTRTRGNQLCHEVTTKVGASKREHKEILEWRFLLD
jgi:hypothetical protein